MAKLTADDVAKARRMRAEGRTLREIGAVLGRAESTLSRHLGAGSAPPSGVVDSLGRRHSGIAPGRPRRPCRWCGATERRNDEHAAGKGWCSNACRSAYRRTQTRLRGFRGAVSAAQAQQLRVQGHPLRVVAAVLLPPEPDRARACRWCDRPLARADPSVRRRGYCSNAHRAVHSRYLRNVGEHRRY